MNQSSPRFDPLQLLDNEWRNRTWKGWLRSRWLGRESVPPPPPEGGASPTIRPPPMASAPAVPTVTREAEARRVEVRSRMDGVFDRLGRVEDSLESLVKRFALHSIHARRHEQRVLERLDASGEMLERQTLAFEAMQAALERVEQRISRMERRWREDDRVEPGKAASMTVESGQRCSTPPGELYEDYADLEEAFAAPTVEALEAGPTSGPSIHGNLSELSLGTVLAMLELERRTGLLQVSSEEGATVTATLRAGAIVGARRREIEADPVEVVREALRYKNGHFWFQQATVEVLAGPARSVGAVLLEATSRNDEAARTG